MLQAILGFGTVSKAPGVRYELVAQNQIGTGFVLEASACPQIEKRLHLIPPPRAVVVSGHLDEIGHGLRRFRLLMTRGSLQGRMGSGNLDVEMLRPLWGKLATVQGIVHFKASGQPRFIEARRISARAEGDKIFETMPMAETGGGQVADVLTESERPGSVSRDSAKAIRRVDPMVLWGAWPGDEPIEELLSALD